MAHDPVIADLNRYLAEQDRAQALDEAEQELFEEWLKDAKKIEDAICDSEILAEADLPKIIASAVVSGDWTRVQGYIQEGLQEFWQPDLEAAIQKEIEQSWADEAEAREISREGDYYD